MAHVPFSHGAASPAEKPGLRRTDCLPLREEESAAINNLKEMAFPSIWEIQGNAFSWCELSGLGFNFFFLL